MGDLRLRSTVFDDFKRWRDDGTWRTIVNAPRKAVRREGGQPETTSMAVIDSQSAEATEVGPAAGLRRRQEVGGRKRRVAVDERGPSLAVAATAASACDRDAAPEVL